VDWCGQPTLWHIDVGHVAFHLVCRYVQSVSRQVTMKDTTLTCFVVRLVELVIVVMSVL